MNIFELEDEITRLREQLSVLKQHIQKIIEQRKKTHPFYCSVCRKDFQTLETNFEIKKYTLSTKCTKELHIVCPVCNRVLHTHSYRNYPNIVGLTSKQLENISKIIPEIYTWCETSLPRPTPYIISIFDKKTSSKYYT
jgi:hypothetical protein